MYIEGEELTSAEQQDSEQAKQRPFYLVMKAWGRAGQRLNKVHPTWTSDQPRNASRAHQLNRSKISNRWSHTFPPKMATERRCYHIRKNIWTHGRKQLISWHVLESTPLVPANQTINKRPFSCNLSKENVIGSHRLRPPFKEMFLVGEKCWGFAADQHWIIWSISCYIPDGHYQHFHSALLQVKVLVPFVRHV